MTPPPDDLLGLLWDEAKPLLMDVNGGAELEPLMTMPPDGRKVLSGAWRVVGYRSRENGWQMIIAQEQQTS